MSYTEGPYVERRETVVEGQPLVEAPVASQRVVVASPAPVAERVRTDRVVRFAADSFITGVVGLALLLLGLIAVTRAGVDTPLRDPVVDVLGFSHTAILGMIEVAFGLVLLASAAARSRAGEVFFGALLGIAAFVAAVQDESFASSLAIEPALAWLGVVAGAVVVLAALMLPRYASRRTTAVDARAY